MFRVKTLRVVLATFFFTFLFLDYAQAIGLGRTSSTRNNVTCILVFGDSTVDPGNNNKLHTSAKGNYLPYGEDFIYGPPSGRFSNGRLATDFIAESLGHAKLIKAFLDPSITKEDLLHGVSFASAASGYDELTANFSNVLSMSKQLEYFRHYIIHLRKMVGTKETQAVLENAMFLISMGTNDFLQNYYIDPTRPKQYNIDQYQNYLISSMRTAIKTMRSLGARRLVVVGVPPLGCVPFVRMLRNDVAKCDVELNKVAFSFNSKIQRELKSLQKGLITSLFLDIYGIIIDAVENPQRYGSYVQGFTESLKGCCGSGAYEYGNSCKNLRTCPDRTKYVFFDAVHPTEKTYKIIADKAIGQVIHNLS